MREFFKRFQIIQVDADGSCLYHSIVNLLRQGNITKYTSTSLRRLAAKQVRSHPEIYAGFINESIEEFTASIERAIDGAAKSKFVPSAMRCSYALKFSMRINDWSMESISVLFERSRGSVESTILRCCDQMAIILMPCAVVHQRLTALR